MNRPDSKAMRPDLRIGGLAPLAKNTTEAFAVVANKTIESTPRVVLPAPPLLIDRRDMRRMPLQLNRQQPDWQRRARIKVTVNGFTCHHETWDHMLEVDGKRDEVWLQADVRMVDRAGNPLVDARQPRTRVHGDIGGNNPARPDFPDRVQAGSAGPLGGIRTGDSHPASPWQRSGPVFEDRLPLLLFEHDTVAPADFDLLITPVVMEYDGGSDLLTDWGDELARYAGTIAGAIVGLFAGPTTGIAVKAAGDAAFPALTNFLQHILGRAGDRPIGTQEQPDGSYAFTPTTVGLSGAHLGTIASVDVGYGPGVIPVRYTDSERLAGDYTLYLQIAYSEYLVDLNALRT